MKLDEVSEISLTRGQQGILIDCKLAVTPEIAYSNLIKTPLWQSVKSLLSFGYINIRSNGITLTEKGESALIQYNCIGDDGMLTDRGDVIFTQYKESVKEYRND